MWDEGTGDGTAGDRPPIADYDHLPKVLVESRAARMPREQVEALLRYESAHRARTPVIRALRSRLHEIEDGGRRQKAVGGYGPPRLPRQPAQVGTPVRRAG
jgi:hypothetical protein